MAFKACYFVLVLGVGASHSDTSSDKELPNVKQVDCAEPGLKDFDACLAIRFGQKKEFAGLKKVDNSPYLMSGEIYSKEGKVKADSRVVFSQVDIKARKGGFFSLMIVDPDSEMYRLKVDKKSGNSEFVVQSPKAVDKVISTKSKFQHYSNASNIIQLRSGTYIPKSGFRMKVLPLIDESFKRHFGRNFQQKVNEIFEFVKAVFLHPSLKTKYRLEVLTTYGYTGYLQDQLNANGLNKLGRSVQSIPLANSYALLTYKRVGSGSFIAGVAWRGTVCASKNKRVNINLYYGDTIRTSETVAHEIGHNLNMNHDFIVRSGQRYVRSSRDGRSCTNQNFIMDYFQRNPRSWSPCSVDDINWYYRATGGYRNCMQRLTNGGNGGNGGPNVCNDRNRNCNNWANRGFCRGRYSQWMGQNCKKSCNLCGNGGNCKDQNRNCNNWANRGFCRGRYSQWMGKNCQKSCAKC